MNRAELRAAARQRLNDLVEGYGWSDAELNGWINEAVREAAIRAGLLSAAVTVALVGGQAEYPLDSAISYVLSARLAAGGLLMRTARATLDAHCADWMATTGTPTQFFIEGRTLTVWPTPAAAATVLLQTHQYPAALTTDQHSPSLEDHEHLFLVEWVIYRAGQKRDMDFTLPNPEQYEASFTRAFGPRPSARVRRGWLESGGTDTARAG